MRQPQAGRGGGSFLRAGAFTPALVAGYIETIKYRGVSIWPGHPRNVPRRRGLKGTTLHGVSGAIATEEAARPVRRRREPVSLLPFAFIAPIFLLLVAVSFYPSLYAVFLGMTDATLLRLARAKYIGLDNVARAFADPVFLNGLWKTLRWDVVVVASEVAIALPVALFLDL